VINLKKTGDTVFFSTTPRIFSSFSVVGKKEGRGPLGSIFDYISQDSLFSQNTWEKAEMEMSKKAVQGVLDKTNLMPEDIDFLLGGDLLNQIVVANFVARHFQRPYLGLFGACATLGESLFLGSTLLDGDFGDQVIAFVSSHYQTAERQYRTPIEYGDQYPPWKQWTVTGSAAFLLQKEGGSVGITQATVGTVLDWGIIDTNDLGGAMVPAAAQTILTNLEDTGRSPGDYDLILTGDLGIRGRDLLRKLLKKEGLGELDNLNDCGARIFAPDQKAGSGGSGCATSAVVLSSYYLPRLEKGDLNRILLVVTGALLNPTTSLQGETIPGIAHALVLERMVD